MQASNNDGIWNHEGASINVTVVPPPWRSVWAYLTYFIVVAVLITGYLVRQRRKLIAEAESRARLELLVKERTFELADRNTELMRANVKLERASVTDALTGLHNRRFVDQFIEAEISMLRRILFNEASSGHQSPDSPQMLFLMMIDLDGFKFINDTFGHNAGDQALIEVKDRLITSCRKSDSIVRWGGDEFLIIGRAHNFEGVETLAEKIRQSLGSPEYNLGQGQSGKLTGSIGVAPLPFVEGKIDFSSWEQVSIVADLAAYIAKRNGRNAWVSLAGTEQMTAEDLLRVKDELGEQVKSDKVRVNSCLVSIRLGEDSPEVTGIA